MNTQTEISPELQALLDTSKPLEDLDLAGLESSIRDLEKSPQHVAETRKASFVEDVLRALDAEGITKSELARRLGKSRQQLNIMLDEEKKNNFTIETMANFSTALGRKLIIRMLAAETEVQLIRNAPVQNLASNPAFRGKTWMVSPSPVLAGAAQTAPDGSEIENTEKLAA